MIDQNLMSWSITSVSEMLIRIELEFENPLEVSQGESPDTLVVQAELGEYLDQDELSLPDSVVRSKSIPAQVGS